MRVRTGPAMPASSVEVKTGRSDVPPEERHFDVFSDRRDVRLEFAKRRKADIDHFAVRVDAVGRVLIKSRNWCRRR